ncbi:glycosyltransferase, partial [Clostridium botulinum]|nr:glycosyltransferase [Clostridium botulinum]
PFSAPVLYCVREYNIANKIIYEDLDDFYDFYKYVNCEDKQTVKIAEEYILSNCDLVFSVSKRLRNHRLNQKNNNNIYVSNNGVHVNKFLKHQCYKRNKDIVFIGSIEEWAGIQLAIKGVKECINNGLVITFDIYGEGSYEAKLRNLVDKLELNAFIKFNGKIEHDRLPSVLSEYKIGVITFIQSNLTKFAHPIKIFEYFASGLPIIGSDIGEIKDIIHNSQAGICIKDEKEFYIALKSILTNKETIKKYRINAYEYVKKFDWNKIFFNEFNIADKWGAKINTCKLELEENNIINRLLDSECYKKFSISKVMNRLEDKFYNQGKRRIAIFGAGDHTRALLKVIKFQRLELIGLIDSNSSLWGNTKFGFKVVSFNQAIKNDVDIVIISSRAFENDIYNSIINECNRNNIEVYRLYHENKDYEEVIWKQLYLKGEENI